MVPEENIGAVLPQKPPFVMIGRLLYADESITRTSFLIKQDNVLMENDFLSEAGLMENIAQTAAAGAGYLNSLKNSPPFLGYIGAVKNLEITGLAKINSELITEVKIETRIFDATVISGRVWCEGKLIAACEMKIFVRPVNDHGLEPI